MYQERMLGYYPEVIQSILEFQAIIGSEYVEFEGLDFAVYRTTLDAYLTTMSEGRIQQWEQALGIQPLENSTFSDRRDTIIARIRGQGKLNTQSINRIVNSFTGGTAKSWVDNGVLYIEVFPPQGKSDYKFPNLERELANKVPAHLKLQVTRYTIKWCEVNSSFKDWGEVCASHATWEDVLYGTRRDAGLLDITPIEDFVLV